MSLAHIPDYDPNTGMAESIVTDKFTETMSKGDDAYTRALAALTTIAALAGQISNINTDLSMDPEPQVDFTPQDVSFPDIDTDVEDFVSKIDPGSYLDVTKLPVDPVTNADYQRIINAVPTEGSFNYSEDAPPGFESALSTLQAKLLVLLGGSSSLISASVQDDMYQKERDRDLQELNDSKQRITADWNKRRVPFPSGGMFNAFSEAEGKYTDRYDGKSREVRAEVRKTEIESMMLAIKEINTVIKNLQDYKSQYWTRKLEAAKQLVLLAIEIYKGTIDVLKTKAEVFGIQSRAFSDFISMVAKVAELEFNAWKAKLDALNLRVEVETKVFTAKVKQAEIELQADTSEEAAKVQRLQLNLQKAVQELQAELKKNEFKYTLADGANKTIGQIAAQLCASLVGAVSASAQISKSVQLGKSMHLQGSESYSHDNL